MDCEILQENCFRHKTKMVFCLIFGRGGEWAAGNMEKGKIVEQKRLRTAVIMGVDESSLRQTDGLNSC